MSKNRDEEVRAYYAALDALTATATGENPWLDRWMPRRLSRREGYRLEKVTSPPIKPKMTWQETVAFLRGRSADAPSGGEEKQ